MAETPKNTNAHKLRAMGKGSKPFQAKGGKAPAEKKPKK
jgi:hypothetical protein